MSKLKSVRYLLTLQFFLVESFKSFFTYDRQLLVCNLPSLMKLTGKSEPCLCLLQGKELFALIAVFRQRDANEDTTYGLSICDRGRRRQNCSGSERSGDTQRLLYANPNPKSGRRLTLMRTGALTLDNNGSITSVKRAAAIDEVERLSLSCACF